MEPKRQVRTDDPVRRKTEKHAALLREIADDAHERSQRYPQETVVPEGGE